MLFTYIYYTYIYILPKLFNKKIFYYIFLFKKQININNF